MRGAKTYYFGVWMGALGMHMDGVGDPRIYQEV
jgi:hypothetical protein